MAVFTLYPFIMSGMVLVLGMGVLLCMSMKVPREMKEKVKVRKEVWWKANTHP